MVEFITLSGEDRDGTRRKADRVPVTGEKFTINNETWTVGIVNWIPHRSMNMHVAHVSLYQGDDFEGERIERPPVGPLPRLGAFAEDEDEDTGFWRYPA